MKQTISSKSTTAIRRSLLAFGVVVLSCHSAHATIYTWNGSSTTWQSPSAWSPTAPAAGPGTTDIAEFNSNYGSNQPATTAANTATPGAIWATTGIVGTVTIGGTGSITLTGTLTVNGNANTGILLDDSAGNGLTVSAPIRLSNSTSFLVNNTGTLTLQTGLLYLNGKTLTLGGTNASGVINITSAFQSTGGAVVVNGAGTYEISGANAFSGGTTLTTGTLVVSTNATALDNGALAIGGGTFVMTNVSGTNLSFSDNTTVSGNTQITSDVTSAGAGNTYTLGTLSIGAQTLTIAGGPNVNSGTAGVTFGATTLTGNATFNITDPTNGGTTVMTGTTVTGGVNTATLTGNGNFAQTGAWSGSAASSLVLASTYTGTAVLSQINTFTGGVGINGGELVSTGTGALGKTSAQVTFGGSGTGTLDLRGNSLAYSSGINTTSAGGNILVEPATALAGVTNTLTLANTWGSNTIVLSPGSLATSNTNYGLTLTGANTFAAANTNATFTINGNGTGNGTLTMSGGFNTGGNTDTLTFNSGSGTGTNSAVVSGAFSGTAGTLVLQGNAPVTIGALTTTANQVEINGTGTYTFSGASTFTGGVVLDNASATVIATTAGGLGSGGQVAFGTSGTTLDLRGASLTYTSGINSTTNGGTITVEPAAAGAGVTNTMSGTNTLGATTVTVSAGALSTANTVYGLKLTGGTTLAGNATFLINNNGTGTGTLTMGAITGNGNNLTLDGAGNFAQSGAFAGAGSSLILDSTYTGTANLSQSNSFTGGAVVDGGVLAMGSTTALNSSIAVTVATGGTFDLNSNSETIAGLNDGSSSTGTVTNSAAAAKILTLGGSGSYSYSGLITSATPADLALTMSGTGTQVISGANNYAGATTISGAGTLELLGSNSTTGVTTMSNAGATLELGTGADGGLASGLLTIFGTVESSDNTSRTISNGITFATGASTLGAAQGNSTNTGNLTFTNVGAMSSPAAGISVNNSTVVTLENGSFGTNAFVKNGTGELVLQNININNGTNGFTLNGGEIQFAGTSTFTGSVLNVNSGVFDFNGTSSSVRNLTGSGGTILNDNNGTTSTFTVGNNNTVTGTYSGSIIDNNNSGTGKIALTVSENGSSFLLLNGTNNYSGPTTLTVGQLEFGKEVSLYNDNTAEWTASNIIVGNASSQATLTLGVGGAGDFTSSDISTLLGLGTATGGFVNKATIGFDTTDGNFSYSNGIANPNNQANILGVSKYGSNTLTLTGNNIYTGTTTVNAGTLLLTQASNDNFLGTFNVAGGDVQVNDTNALYSTVLTLSSNNGLVFNSGLGTAALAGLAGSGNEQLQDGSTNSGAAVQLQLGQYANTSPSGTYTGTLTGTGGVTKVGSGTQIFGASNTYTGPTIVNAVNATSLGTLQTGLSGASGTPFGTGSITIYAGNLGFAPGATGTTSLSIASGAGSTLTYSGDAVIKLTKNTGTATPEALAVTAGSGSGNVLVRTNNGVLIIQTSAADLGAAEQLFINGTAPSTSGPGSSVNASIVGVNAETQTGMVTGLSTTTSTLTTTTFTSTAASLPDYFTVGSSFLGTTVKTISGTSGAYTIVLNASESNMSTSVSFTSIASAGDFLTYNSTSGFLADNSNYTTRSGTIAAGTTGGSSEITALVNGGNGATFSGNNVTGGLVIGQSITATLNSGVVLSVGDNTAGHQAGIILDSGSINGGGTLNFGADEGIIYDFVNGETIDNTTAGYITGTGGLTFAGNQTLSLQDGISGVYTGGVNIDGITLNVDNANSSGGGHSTQTNGLGDPTNVITINGGALGLTGFNYEGRSVVLGPAGGTVAGPVNISGSGALYTGSGGNGFGLVQDEGNNTYTGGTFINGILLGIETESNLGSSTSTITINGSAGAQSGLYIVGNDLTSLSNPIDFTANARMAMDIVSSTNTFTLSQQLNLGTGGLALLGNGTLVLTAAETYTGATYLFGGTLLVDASQGGSLASTSGLNFEGGTIDFKGSGGTTTQNIGNITVAGTFGSNANGGNEYSGGEIIADNNGGTLNLNFGSLPDAGVGSTLIQPGNSMPFIAKGSGTSNITTTSAPDSSTGNTTYGGSGSGPTGVYDGRYVYVTEDSSGNVTSANWATGVNNSGTYTMQGYNNYIDINLSPSATDNTSVTDNETLSFTGAVNSLMATNTQAGQTFDMATNTLTITGGGLLFTGSNNYTISDGAIQSGLSALSNFYGGVAGSSDLYLQQWGTGTLTISASILNYSPTGSLTMASTVTKAGPGTVVLSGNNSYQGWTFVTGGTLSVSSTANLGGTNGTIAIATSSISSTSVTLDSSVTSLPNGFGIGTDLLGTTIKSITGSPGAYVITLNANANAATSSTATASWVSSGSQVVYLNGGTLQISATLVAQTNSSGAIGGTATGGTPSLQLGGSGGGIDVIDGASFSSGINTYGTTTGAPASFTMNSSDGTGTFNMGGTSFQGQITILGGTLNSSGGNPTEISANAPIVFGSGNETATGGAANTHPTLGGSDNFLYTGGLISPATTTALVNYGGGLVITDYAGNIDSYSGQLAGSMRLIKGGAGTQDITNTNNTYTGVTRIDDGVLNVGDLANEGTTNAFTGSITTVGSSVTAVLSGTGTAGLVSGQTYGLTSTDVAAGTTFTYTGSNTVTLSNAATATGTISVSALDAASSLGISSSAASNLLFGGYTQGSAALQYTGSTAISTDRLFTLGDIDNAGQLTGNFGTLDASGTGTGTMSWTNTGTIGINSNTFSDAFEHGLTLTGSNTGSNTFAAALINAPTLNTPTITGLSGGMTISVSSNSGLFVGESVSGTGIAPGAYITTIAGTTITLSTANSGAVSGTGSFLDNVTTSVSGTSGTNTITVGSATNLFVGESISGTGIASGTTILGISGTTLTLSANTTSAVSGNGFFQGGIVSLWKTGGGTWYVTNNTSSFTGATTIDGGILNTSSLANIGVASAIGAGNNTSTAANQASLVFNGGTLQYTGTTVQTTNRLFTIGDSSNTTSTNAATIDASGGTGDTVTFSSTGALGYVNSGVNHSLTLTGSNTGANTFNPLIADDGVTSVNKTGPGTWVLTNANTYTGGTTVGGGSLYLNNTAGSAAGTGSLTVNGGTTLGGTGSYGTTLTPGTGFNIAGTGTATGLRANVLVGMASATDNNTMATLGLIASTGSISNANLTFNINAFVGGGLGTDPTNSGTQLNVGSTAITFGSGTQSTTLTLNIQGLNVIGDNTTYVLFAGNTAGAIDQYSGLTLGTGTGNIATGLLTPILNSGVGQSGDLTLALTGLGGLADTWYGPNSYLFLYQNSTSGIDDIEVEVVPEPGTWALMLGGLAMLVFWQRSRRKTKL